MSRLLLIPAVAVTLLTSDAVAQPIKVGEPYPDFVLPRVGNGEAVSRDSLPGKPTVLIHFASW